MEQAVRLYVLVVMLALCSCAEQRDQTPQLAAPIPEASTDAGNAQVGKASIYSERFAGKRTASGKILDASADVVASNSLPLGSTAKVTNLETGKSEVVKVEVRIPTMPSGHTELKASTYSDLMPSTVLR
jgi:rare lipoprotein A